MVKIFAIIFSLLLFTTTVSAQGFIVKGMVRDSINHEPLIGVNIMLVPQQDSDEKHFATTDLEGNFAFSNIKPGNYHLTATYVGYSKFEQAILVQNEPVLLGNLYFSPSIQMMEGVVIQAKVSQSVLLGDTTQFNAGAFKTTADASSQDLIEKLPGISMQNGTLQAQGEDVQQILVDGKPFFGNDVKAALQSLPAEVIASIQVFDKKSDKAELSGFDDGERQKTINIVTKPNRKKGQFGKASVGYGTDDKYQVGTSVNFFSDDRRVTVTGLSNNINAVSYSADPNSQGDSRTQNGLITTNSIGVNFSDEWGEKIEFSGSYLFSHRKNEDNAKIFREYVLSSDSGQVYTEDNYTNRRNMDHRIAMRFEYNIDTNNRILIRPRILLNNEQTSTHFLGRTVTDNGPLNQTENTSDVDHYNYDFENRMYYSHRFKKQGRSFTIGLNTSYHANEEDANQLAYNVFYKKEDSLETLNQHAILNRNAVAWETNLSYTEPIGKNGMVELEYEIGNKINDSDKLTYFVYEEEFDDSYSLLDTARSNTFNSGYLTQNVELGYQYATKKLRVQMEAEYQHALLQNDQEFPAPFDMQRTFGSWLPTVRLDYKFSNSKSIEIDYDTRTNEPSIGQLQDVIDNTNPLHLRTGNPDLDQSYSNRIRARYRGRNPETDQSFFVYLASSIIKDNVANSVTIAEEPIELRDGVVLEKGSQLTRPVNINGYWDFRSYISYGKPLDFIKSNINLSGGLRYIKNPGMVNKDVNFVNTSSSMLGLSLSSNISEKVDFYISTRARYNSVENSLRPELNENFFNQTTRLSYDWIFWKGFVYRANLNHQFNTGLAEGYDNSFLLLNMSIGKKFLKNDLAEVSLNVYDLLAQNNNISRNVSELYIEDRQSTVLQQYFMLSLTYNIRRFSQGASMNDFEGHSRN